MFSSSFRAGIIIEIEGESPPLLPSPSRGEGREGVDENFSQTGRSFG
jgi:hypothetical protein